MNLSWSSQPEEASYNCVRSGSFSASTSGVGKQTVPATGNPEDRDYVMPARFDYEATETCNGYYDAYLTPEATEVTRCTFSAQATADIHDFSPEAGQGPPPYIKLTYREGASPGEHTWGLHSSSFNPGINHTVSLEDSCDQLAVTGKPIQGGVALPEGMLTGPARSALVAGSTTISGQTMAGSGMPPTDWNLDYVGPEVTAAPKIGTASSGQLGAPVNATTRWMEPSNNGRLTRHGLQSAGPETERLRRRDRAGHEVRGRLGAIACCKAHQGPLQVPGGRSERQGAERLVGQLQHRQGTLRR